MSTPKLRITTDGLRWRVERYSRFRAFFWRRWAWMPIRFYSPLYPLCAVEKFCSYESAKSAIDELAKADRARARGWRCVMEYVEK